MEGWGEFALAAAGATGALAGLLIVAISVNVQPILGSPAATRGAQSSVAGLVLALVVALLFLIPDQPYRVLGTVVVAALIPVTVLQSRAVKVGDEQGPQVNRPRAIALVTAALAGLQLAPFLLGAVLLVADEASGMYCLAAGIIAVVIGSMIGAWVLLIEVLR